MYKIPVALMFYAIYCIKSYIFFIYFLYFHSSGDKSKMSSAFPIVR